MRFLHVARMANHASSISSSGSFQNSKDVLARHTEAKPYHWSIELRYPSPDGRAAQAQAETMSAAEQMFFLGAPLAHVVQYEEGLRADRQERDLRRLARLRTAFRRRG